MRVCLLRVVVVCRQRQHVDRRRGAASERARHQEARPVTPVENDRRVLYCLTDSVYRCSRLTDTPIPAITTRPQSKSNACVIVFVRLFRVFADTNRLLPTPDVFSDGSSRHRCDWPSCRPNSATSNASTATRHSLTTIIRSYALIVRPFVRSSSRLGNIDQAEALYRSSLTALENVVGAGSNCLNFVCVVLT